MNTPKAKPIKIFTQALALFIIVFCSCNNDNKDKEHIPVKEPFFWSSELNWLLEFPPEVYSIPINEDSTNNFIFKNQKNDLFSDNFKVICQLSIDEFNYLTLFWQKDNIKTIEKLNKTLESNDSLFRLFANSINLKTEETEFLPINIDNQQFVSRKIKMYSPQNANEVILQTNYYSLCKNHVIEVLVSANNEKNRATLDSVVMNSKFNVELKKKNEDFYLIRNN